MKFEAHIIFLKPKCDFQYLTHMDFRHSIRGNILMISSPLFINIPWAMARFKQDMFPSLCYFTSQASEKKFLWRKPLAKVVLKTATNFNPQPDPYFRTDTFYTIFPLDAVKYTVRSSIHYVVVSEVWNIRKVWKFQKHIEYTTYLDELICKGIKKASKRML